MTWIAASIVLAGIVSCADYGLLSRAGGAVDWLTATYPIPSHPIPSHPIPAPALRPLPHCLHQPVGCLVHSPPVIPLGARLCLHPSCLLRQRVK